MNFAILILFALLAVFVVYIKQIYRWMKIAKFYLTIPGPTVAELIDVVTKDKFLHWMHEMGERYGRVYRILFGRDIMVIFSDADDMQQILSSNQLLYKSNNYKQVEPWLGRGLLTNGGASWHRRRKLLTPAFHFRILSEFKAPIEENCRILVSRLRQHVDGDAFDIYPYLTLFALDVICETAMGIKKNAQMESSSEYVRAVQIISQLIHERTFLFWQRNNIFYDYTAAGRQMSKTLQVLHGETDRVIKLRRRILQESNIHTVAEAEQTDHTDDIGKKRRFAFLDTLLLGQMEGNGLTDREIREEVDTFMFAGHDTTSGALGFALYFLSQHPEAQQKAYEEAKTMEGSEKDRMLYLEAVIKETLRIYPSAPFFSRFVNEDMQIGTVTLPKGVSIMISAYGVQHNPKYFQQPEKFNPERFLHGNDKNLHPYAFFAFSAGPRNCMGQKLAMLELKCSLAHLLRNYEFLPVDTEKPLPIINIVIRSKNGIRLRIKLRK